MQAGPPRVRLRTDVESQARGTGSGDSVLLQEVHRISDEAAVRFQPQLRMPWEAGIWSTVFAGQVPFGLGHPMNEPLRPVPMPTASTRSAPESVPPAPLKDLTARRLKTAHSGFRAAQAESACAAGFGGHQGRLFDEEQSWTDP